jgi:hypothetical protein
LKNEQPRFVMRLVRHDERDRVHSTDTDASATASAEESIIATGTCSADDHDGRSWLIDERRGAAYTGVKRAAAAAAAVTAAANHCYCHADRCHADSCCHAAYM